MVLLPCSPQNSQPGTPTSHPHGPGLSILHEFELPQPSISGPVVCTISDNFLHISYTQAAPLLKPGAPRSDPLPCSQLSCAVSMCLCASHCRSPVHETCVVGVNGFEMFLGRTYLSDQQGEGTRRPTAGGQELLA